MKVALIGAFPPQEKGEGHYLGRFAHALRTSNSQLELSVLSQYVDQPYEEQYNGFRVRRVIRDRSVTGVSYAPQQELVDAVLAEGADIAHLQYGPNTDYGGRLGEMLVPALQQLRRRGVKTVVTLHSLWLPADVRDSAAARKLPAILRRPVEWYFGMFMRRLTNASDVLVGLVSGSASPMTEAFTKAYRLPEIAEEMHGCELRFQRHEINVEPVIFSFGFMREDKGYEYLIRAFAERKRLGLPGKLILAGRAQGAEDEAYVDKLRAEARGIKDINFRIGYLSDEDLEHQLQLASVIVLPYLRNVGPSGPLHHALGVGKPVIATNLGHNAALSGEIYLIPPGDVNALSCSLSDVLDDHHAYLSWAEKARAAAKRRSWDALAHRYLEMYQRLIT